MINCGEREANETVLSVTGSQKAPEVVFDCANPTEGYEAGPQHYYR